jgi:hypothetical protein
VGNAAAVGTASAGTAGASAASTGPSATVGVATPGAHGSPAAQGAASPGVAGSASANGISAAGTGIGGVGGIGGGPSAAQQAEACRQAPADDGACAAARAYSMQAIYFNPRLYSSEADCLTAAYAAHLPLNMCR